MKKSVWRKAAEVVDRRWTGCCWALTEAGAIWPEREWFDAMFNPDRPRNSCAYWWDNPIERCAQGRTARVLALLFMHEIEKDEQ